MDGKHDADLHLKVRFSCSLDALHRFPFIVKDSNYSGTQLVDITCDFFIDFVIPEFL